MVMINMNKEHCIVCGKEIHPSLSCNQYIEKMGKVVKVCKNCLINGDFHSKFGE